MQIDIYAVDKSRVLYLCFVYGLYRDENAAAARSVWSSDESKFHFNGYFGKQSMYV
jgi:hypothetical protein